MGYALGIVVAVNSVIALFYYANVARQMWFEDAPDGDLTPIRIPAALTIVLGLAVAGTVAFGFAPGVVGHFGEAATDLFALARP